MQLTQKECEIWKKEKRILEVKHTKSIYSETRKLVKNSVVTTTYVNVAKLLNNSIQNQGMTNYEMIDVIKKMENTNRITKKKHDQPVNQAPC